ncbi:hypothetical protein A3Q56_04437 [Intoshia linei]|uniref:EF-hand domain-containing protein n=1 Tax=Intoshia linei TaxID=1819745 RepID=A0A177B0M5_9BILA|nr:hypothetical protein A3Q56_04437 [Intoshia linei]
MQLPRLSLDRTVSSSKSFKNSQSLNIVGECATLDNLPDITVKKKVDSYSKVKMNGNTSVLGLVKVKLRRAYKILLEKFLKYDLDGTQYINKEYFIEIIKSLNTDIELKYLPSLLSECDINVNRTTIPYTKFLMQFMDRSLGSITHRTLTSQKLKTGMVKLEYEIVSYLQCEFLKLLALFQKYDTLSRGIISVEDCKHCLEVFIGLTIQKNEMDCLLVRLPTSMDGANIHYIDFMKELNFNELRNSSKISNLSISTKMRTQEQLILIIRKNITNNLPLIEKYFEEIDIANTKRLTQDYMYLIFKK